MRCGVGELLTFLPRAPAGCLICWDQVHLTDARSAGTRSRDRIVRYVTPRWHGRWPLGGNETRGPCGAVVPRGGARSGAAGSRGTAPRTCHPATKRSCLTEHRSHCPTVTMGKLRGTCRSDVSGVLRWGVVMMEHSPFHGCRSCSTPQPSVLSRRTPQSTATSTGDSLHCTSRQQTELSISNDMGVRQAKQMSQSLWVEFRCRVMQGHSGANLLPVVASNRCAAQVDIRALYSLLKRCGPASSRIIHDRRAPEAYTYTHKRAFPAAAKKPQISADKRKKKHTHSIKHMATLSR